MFRDPYAKLCFVAHLVSQFENVTYVDLDTTFTAYFNAGVVRADSIDIYLPSEGRLVPMIKDILESMASSSILIFDSVNSFYNLFPARERIGSLNHLLAVLLMLLVRSGMDKSIPVLATSMLRYRKYGGWVQSPASRRLLQQKSAARLSVERSENDLAITVVDHESMPTGTQVVYKNCLIRV